QGSLREDLVGRRGGRSVAGKLRADAHARLGSGSGNRRGGIPPGRGSQVSSPARQDGPRRCRNTLHAGAMEPRAERGPRQSAGRGRGANRSRDRRARRTGSGGAVKRSWEKPLPEAERGRTTVARNRVGKRGKDSAFLLLPSPLRGATLFGSEVAVRSCPRRCLGVLREGEAVPLPWPSR